MVWLLLAGEFLKIGFTNFIKGVVLFRCAFLSIGNENGIGLATARAGLVCALGIFWGWRCGLSWQAEGFMFFIMSCRVGLAWLSRWNFRGCG